MANSDSASDDFLKDPTQEFIEKITESRKDGFGFVPLVGAGLSAPSGVPIIREVRDYLRKCVAMALGLDHPQAWKPGCINDGTSDKVCRLDFHEFRRWLPGRDEWPHFGDPQLFERDPVNWEQRLFEVFNEIRERIGRDRTAFFPEADVFQEASGVSAEWRSLLLFLSRLKLKNPSRETGTKTETDLDSLQPGGACQANTGDSTENEDAFYPHLLTLGEPDRGIVDTFFLNVVKGKQPTLGHRMLARLAGPLRINTALTTNFDELLEEAFLETHNVFTVFDVHIDTGLPSYRHLHHKNSLVKLHGGRFGLRADYTLDKPPSDDDVRHFVSYLAAANISESVWRDRDVRIPTRRHLLVVGISGDDERIELMIREAAHRLINLRVFWVAYQKKEVEKARRMLVRATPSKGNGFSFHVLRHQFAGLLFLQCYQELSRALPASRAVFPSTPRLPVPPEFVLDEAFLEKAERSSDSAAEAIGPAESDEDTVRRLSKYRTVLRDRINEAIERSNHDDDFRRIVVMHGAHDRFFGASTAAALAFDDELDGGRQCVWIDLDEVSSCNDLFESILYTMARKAGVVDWMPVLLQTDDSDLNRKRIAAAQLNEVARITNNPNREWVIFVNARSGAGTNYWPTGDFSKDYERYPNGWLDVCGQEADDKVDAAHRDGADPTATGDNVIELLDRLCGRHCPNVTVVLLCFENGRFFHSIRRRLPEIPEPIKGEDESVLVGCPTNVKSKDLIQAALKWMESPAGTKHEKEMGRKKLLQARSQFLYSLCLANRVRYPAMLWTWPFHNTENQADTISQRAKIWVRALEKAHVVRRKRGGFIWIHCEIRNGLRQELLERKSVSKHLKALTIKIHAGLAEWYHKLFCESHDPSSAFEVVYHRMLQVHAVIQSAVPNHEWMEQEEDRDRSGILVALSNARQVLEISLVTMLSAGFSNSICRRLEQIRKLHITVLEEELAKSPWTQIPDAFHEIRHRIHLLRMASLRLNRSVAREVGENVVAFQRHRELRVWQYVFNRERGDEPVAADVLESMYASQCEEVEKHLTDACVTDETIRELAAEESTREQSQEIRDRRESANGLIYNYLPEKSVPELQRSSIEPAARWESPRSWIESNNVLGTLGIAIRSFDFSTTKFQRVFKFVRLPGEIWPKDRSPDQIPEGSDYVNPFEKLFTSEEGSRSDFRKWLRRDLPARCEKLLTFESDASKRKKNGESDKSTKSRRRRHADAIRQILFGLTKTLQRSQQQLQARGQVYLALARRIHRVGQRGSSESFSREVASPIQLRRAANECFDRSRWCFELAREVMRHVNRDAERFAMRRRNGYVPRDVWFYWYEDRQRLETLASLALAFSGDHERARRRLNEAEASLGELRRDEYAMERAIIDLHRAEVLIQQATSRPSDMANYDSGASDGGEAGGKGDGSSGKDESRDSSAHGVLRFDKDAGLSELRDPVLATIHEEDSSRCLAAIYKAIRRAMEPDQREWDPEDVIKRVRQSLAYMDDAWQTLARAERLLKQHRKNVWWTTWFFELQLKLVELRLFAGFFERCIVLGVADKGEGNDHCVSVQFASGDHERLPFLGLDAVPHGTPSVADQLLDSAERMVRLDLFRIARIAESYANCLLALSLWRQSLDRKCPFSDWTELGRRQKEMRSRLVLVRKSLEKRTERRNELDAQWTKTKIDPHVAEYVRFVIAHIEHIEDLALQGLWPFENQVEVRED